MPTLYDGDDEAEEFYIGIGNFAERTGSVPLVYDWRAPVSGLFYDYDKGPASYEAPGGLMEGEIVSKGRVWVIETDKGTVIIPFKAIIHMHPQY